MSTELGKVLKEVDFSGGAVSSYVELIKQLAGNRASLNIIVKASAKNVNLPSIQLKQVTIGTAFEAMTAASSEVTTELSGGDDEESYLIVQCADDGEGPQVLVLNIKDALATHPRDELSKTIESGLEFLDGEDIQIQLHEETGLMFAKGSPRALNLVREIIIEMSKGAEREQKDIDSLKGTSGGVSGGSGGKGTTPKK